MGVIFTEEEWAENILVLARYWFDAYKKAKDQLDSLEEQCINLRTALEQLKDDREQQQKDIAQLRQRLAVKESDAEMIELGRLVMKMPNDSVLRHRPHGVWDSSPDYEAKGMFGDDYEHPVQALRSLIARGAIDDKSND